tara:strand:- start:1883 stop:2836 length:954 start_codon:yes stop_codon:yes gene_type:complete
MAIAYCTDRELKDVYPHIDDFDNKTPIYGFENTDTPNQYQANNTGLITHLFFDGIKGTSVTDSPNETYEYNYSSTTDSVQVFHATKNPNDMLIEAGEDWATLKQRYRENASRYLESKLDKTLPREQFKDKDGNYDYIIVRTTALLATVFLIRSHDPTSEVASNMMEEAQAEIDKLNSGDNVLSWMKTADSSKGIVREVSVSGGLKIVDTRGRYYGVYDRVGVKITTGGALGTAKYSVWRKDSENLGAERMNNGLPADFADEVINGQYQSLSGGLEIRFGGDTADTATLGDKWEIELSGYFEEVDNASSMRSARMTRL